MNNFVFDTSILIHHPQAIYAFPGSNIYIPTAVLRELDDLKDSGGNACHAARVALRELEGFVSEHALQMGSGVPLNEHSDGKLYFEVLEDELATQKVDDRIILACLQLQNRGTPNITLLSRDAGLRLRAIVQGVSSCMNYDIAQQTVKDSYDDPGYHYIAGDFWELVGDEFGDVASKYLDEGVTELRLHPAALRGQVHIRQYILDDNQFVARVESIDTDEIVLHQYSYQQLMSISAWGLRPQDVLQAIAMHALMDTEIDVVILRGPAGTGKSLLSVAAGLEMTSEQGQYRDIVVTRNTPPIAEESGFLPGTEEEKILPYLGGITDAIEFLHESDSSPKASANYLMDSGVLKYKTVNTMRGRSLNKRILMIEEAQNLTVSAMVSLVTRVGRDAKLIIVGCLEPSQIDAKALTVHNSGLAYISKLLRHYHRAVDIELVGGVRSELVTFINDAMSSNAGI